MFSKELQEILMKNKYTCEHRVIKTELLRFKSDVDIENDAKEEMSQKLAERIIEESDFREEKEDNTTVYKTDGFYFTGEEFGKVVAMIIKEAKEIEDQFSKPDNLPFSEKLIIFKSMDEKNYDRGLDIETIKFLIDVYQSCSDEEKEELEDIGYVLVNRIKNIVLERGEKDE